MIQRSRRLQIARLGRWSLLLPCFLFAASAWGHDRGVLKGLKSPVSSVSFGVGGKTLAAVGGSGDALIVWDLEKQKEIIRLKGKLSAGGYAVFSPDGKSLAVSGYKEPSRIYETANWRLRHSLDIESTRMAAFSADSSLVAFSCFSGAVILYEVATGKLVDLIYPSAGRVVPLAFSPDGKFLAAGGEDNLVLWDLKEKKVHARLKSHRSPLQVVFAPDGKTLVSVGYGPIQIAYLWDPIRAKKTGEIKLEVGVWGNDAAFSPDGKTLAFVGGGDPGIFLWDSSGGRRIGVLTPDKNTIEVQICIDKVAFSPDGTFLATGAANGRVSLWSLPKRDVWTKKDRLERIEKLVLRLDNADYQGVRPVVRELIQLGDDVLPSVEKAAASEKLYQRLAAEFCLRRRAYERKKVLV